MYNIHSHYQNIFSYVKTKVNRPVLLHLHPFGSTDFENIEVMHCDGTGRSPIFLCYDQEPLLLNYNRPLFQKIKLEWGSDRRIILLNTELDSQIKKSYCEEFDFLDCYYFFHALAAADWYRGYNFDNTIISPTKRKIKKKYITFNRLTGGARVYRSIFISMLAQNQIVNHGHISYSSVCPEFGHYKDNLIDGIVKYDFVPGFLENCKTVLDTINEPLRIDQTDVITNASFKIGAIQEAMESFVHVVTETCFWENKLHLTEKIFKPIVLKQPFILLGCSYNLAYLRRYGFKTFNSWWDENYDNVVDPITRLECVTKIITSLCSKTDKELEEMLVEMNDVLEHNYNLFFSKQFVNSIWQELIDNLNNQLDLIPRPMLAGM